MSASTAPRSVAVDPVPADCTGPDFGLTALSDAAVAAGFVRGQEDSLTDVYQRWSGVVHALAWRLLGDVREAEDVTQQVFLAAWGVGKATGPTADHCPGAARPGRGPG
jgi:RNA polymerase sigma-70 factor (ECF subfamily)